MKKPPLLGLGLLALAPAVLAQSSVNIYGMLDVGVRRMPNLAVGEDHIMGVDDASRSRWGLIGKEDLGDGLSAFFRLESSVRVDTGALRDQKFWDDKAWVGLDHAKYGNLALGRLRAPIDVATSGVRYEAFEGFSLAAALGRYGRSDDGWDNTVYYISPVFAGFKAGVALRAGEGSVRSSRGGHLEYRRGPIDITVAYQVDGETLSSVKKSAGGGMSYAFGPFTLFGSYVRTWDLGAADSGTAYTASLGVRVPMGPGELRAALRKVDTDRLTSATSFASDVDTTHVGLGYWYPLSKRTSINASLVRQTRKTYAASGAVATDRQGFGQEIALRVYF